MKTQTLPDNDIRHSDRRHPADFLQPLPTPDDQLHHICEVLSRTFGWVAEADTVEQKGLRASVDLYCVRVDLLGTETRTSTSQRQMNTMPADTEQKAALDAIAELFSAQYSEAVDSVDKDGKFGIGFKVTFDRSHSTTKLKVTSRMSKSLTDEIETSVPDPSQPELL